MKIHDCEQGTEQWLRVRAGLPTASAFDRILTPKKLKASESQDAYAAHLVAEWFLGEPIETGGSGFTDRGTGMEDEARKWYAFDRDCEVTKVGFVTTDDGLAGCSPDGLVGEDGLVEIKCPAAHTHMQYLLHGFGTDYILQVQGQLWVTGRKWCDRFAFHPVFPKVIERIERDETIIAAIDKEVRAFVEKLSGFKERLADEQSAYMEKVRILREQAAAMSEADAVF